MGIHHKMPMISRARTAAGFQKLGDTGTVANHYRHADQGKTELKIINQVKKGSQIRQRRRTWN